MSFPKAQLCSSSPPLIETSSLWQLSHAGLKQMAKALSPLLWSLCQGPQSPQHPSQGKVSRAGEVLWLLLHELPEFVAWNVCAGILAREELLW